MMMTPIPVLGFCAFSGVGKTTLLIKIIANLTQKGVRIGVIKQSHHDFEIDNPKKDSARLRQAGAQQLCISSAYRDVFIREHAKKRAPSLDSLIAGFQPEDTDIIFVEGFKHACIAKIECYRPSLNHPLLALKDEHVIAIASDEIAKIRSDLPLLDINSGKQISEFILQEYLEKSMIAANK